MPKITIIRPDEWVNQAKHINIFIDGEKAGRIGINQTVHFDLSVGKHKVELRNRWLGGSKPLPIIRARMEIGIRKSQQSISLLIVPFSCISKHLYHGADLYLL